MHDGTAPESVGPYLVYDQIAQGGMATVNLARLINATGFSRTVVIKRLHPRFATDTAFVSMLLDEGRIAGQLHHPNIVPVLDVARSGGQVYLVMDYVHGESLAKLVELHALRIHTVPDVRVIAAAVAGALHGLHAAHETTGPDGATLAVVHRDLTPRNILVGADGAARVVDFGIAKAAGRLQQTRVGQLKGTLRYMAPEQLLEDGVDRRADIYATGVTLWEALTGERLFGAQRDPDAVADILYGTIEPPSRRAAHVPPALDAIVMRALERDPSRRYPTALAMAKDIESALGVVAPSAVAAWVESCASGELAARAARVAEIEARSASDFAKTKANESVPVAVTARPRRPDRARAIVAGTLFAVLATGALLVAGVESRRGATSRSTARAVASSEPPPVPTPGFSAPTSPPSLSVDPAASLPAPALPVRSVRPAPRRGAARAVEPAPTAASPACDPPFTFDERGHKIYKVGCLAAP